MIDKIALLSLSLGVALGNPSHPVKTQTAFHSLNRTKINVAAACCQEDLLGLDDQIWGNPNHAADKQALLTSIENSLRYLRTDAAEAAYRHYVVTGITRERTYRSLVRFRQLIISSNSPEELQDAINREFDFYESVGKDDQGTVYFTAYYQPIHQASRTRTQEYRYPIYRLPANLSHWPKPHPTRAELEGEDGLQASRGPLKGLELFWLRDRLDAFLIQIEGSARLQLTDGTETTVGFAGRTDYPYTSIGREIAKDGKLPLDGLSMPVMKRYFKQNPLELNNYLPRNRGFIFFKETYGSPAMGNLNVPVMPERSIATDKSQMPPGGLALVHTKLPYFNGTGQIEERVVSRYVLDQDTGSAIKGPGRVDYYMGEGEQAGERAGVTGSNGQLYYLLLKE